MLSWIRKFSTMSNVKFDLSISGFKPDMLRTASFGNVLVTTANMLL